jgi:phage gpG-like protein
MGQMRLGATVDGFDHIFALNIERASDLREPLRETGREIQESSKETFADEKSRTGEKWKPLAESTKVHLQQTTTGPVTIKGHVREKYKTQVARYLKNQQRAGKYNHLVGQEFYRLTHGGAPTDAVHESVRGSFKRLRREFGKTEEKRRRGKRASAKHSLLGRMYRMIKLRVGKVGAEIGILKDSPLAIHNVGGRANHGANIPARTFIELIASDLNSLAARLVEWIIPDDQ